MRRPAAMWRYAAIAPEDLDVSGGTPDTLCNDRYFKVRAFSHYIDTDFRCCDCCMTL